MDTPKTVTTTSAPAVLIIKVDSGHIKPYLQQNSGVFLTQFMHNFIYDQQLSRFSLRICGSVVGVLRTISVICRYHFS